MPDAGGATASMQPKLKTWIVFPGGTKFGAGRCELFRLVDEEGSLKRAVEKMGMSYRAAWGYVRELEAAAGVAFLEPAGPGRSGGTRLTAEGRAFLASFEAFQAELESSASHAFESAFEARPRKPGRRPARRRRPAREVRA